MTNSIDVMKDDGDFYNDLIGIGNEKGEKIDYFIMGHWHIMRNIELTPESRFIFLGDWITRFSYGVFDGETFELKQF